MITYPLQTKQTLSQSPVTQADLDRQREMARAWNAYRGKLPDPLKVEADQPNDNVKTNRCAPIVNKVTSFLFGQTVKIEMKGSDQDFMEDLWGDEDESMTRFAKMSINGACFGEVFLKLIPNPKQGQAPRLVILNPQIVRIVSHPDDCELHLAYIIEYPGMASLQKKQIIARVDPEQDLETLGDEDIEDTWTIANYIRRGQNINAEWIQTSQEDWPYPFAPISAWQNLPNPNEAWGAPDLADDLVQLNIVLNFIQSNLSRIIKFHGHPKTFAVNVQASQIQIAVDETICLPSPDSKLEMLAPMENFSGLLNVIVDLRGSMDEQSRVPAVALGRLHELPRGTIAGVALKLLFQPLLELTLQKQRLYGCGIRDVTRAALCLAGKISVEEYEDYEVNLTWPNLLPSDDLAAAQAGLLLEQIGVSEETVLGELGYDIDDEFSKRVNESQREIQAGLKQQQPQQQPGGDMQQQQQQGQPSGGNQSQQQQGGQQAA
jgi:hypothetical protein